MELEVVSDRSNMLEVTGKSEIHREIFYHVHVKIKPEAAVLISCMTQTVNGIL